MGVSKTSEGTAARLADAKLWAVAYHEAGHAVMHVYLDRPARRATIVPDGSTLGYVQGYKRPAESRVINLDESGNWKVAVPHVMELLAGQIAECIHTGRRRSLGSGSDDRAVNELLYRVCHGWHESREMHRWLWSRTEHALTLPRVWAAVKKVAAGLIDRKTLKGSEVRELYYEVTFDGPESRKAAAELRSRGYVTDGQRRWSDGLRKPRKRKLAGVAGVAP